jgi:PTS system cellobiose-specific IIC component
MDIRSKLSRFENVAVKLQQNKYLNAISSGLASLMPIIIVGALSVVVDTLNIGPYQSFLEGLE